MCQNETHLYLLRLSATDREQSTTLWTGGILKGAKEIENTDGFGKVVNHAITLFKIC